MCGGEGMAECESSENGEIRKDVDDLLRFCSLGFDKQELERKTKEIGKINRAWRRLNLPTQVLLTQEASIGFLAPHISSLSRADLSFPESAGPAIPAPLP